jgi:uncharacterized OB-fold protein
MTPGGLLHPERSGHGTRCTKCDAIRVPLLRLEGDPHAYCENCFVVSGETVFVRLDDDGVEVWGRRRIA